jgi:hypothetical protein
LVFFGWGKIFSLFPSTLTDTLGTRHARRNYGYLYKARGIGAIFGGPHGIPAARSNGNADDCIRHRHSRRFNDGRAGNHSSETAAPAGDNSKPD